MSQSDLSGPLNIYGDLSPYNTVSGGGLTALAPTTPQIITGQAAAVPGDPLVAGGKGTNAKFTKRLTGIAADNSTAQTLFTLTIPNSVNGAGFLVNLAGVIATPATGGGSGTPGDSTRFAQFTGAVQRAAGALAKGGLSALANNVIVTRTNGDTLAFGTLAATQGGGATASNTIVISVVIDSASATGGTAHTDIVDLVASIELLNDLANGVTVA